MLVLADARRLSGPEVSQLDSRITLTILLLSLTPNINIKVSRCDLCILSGSLTRLSGNRINHNTTRPSTCFYAFFFSSVGTQQNTHLFVPQRRVKQYLHGRNSIKQTFYDPNCICRASGRWTEDGWQMVKTSNLGDLWSLLRSIIVTQADPITMKYSTPCGSTSCLPYG